MPPVPAVLKNAPLNSKWISPTSKMGESMRLKFVNRADTIAHSSLHNLSGQYLYQRTGLRVSDDNSERIFHNSPQKHIDTH